MLPRSRLKRARRSFQPDAQHFDQAVELIRRPHLISCHFMSYLTSLRMSIYFTALINYGAFNFLFVAFIRSVCF
jgi:hypothetical protein